MSKEFEEILLKKLDNLEIGLKDNNIKLNNLENESKTTKQELEKMSARLGKLEIEVKDTQEVVQCINNNFIKFDYEINKKIDTLFDGYSVNQAKDHVHEDNIVSLNTKIFNHDIRISNLEDKVLTA